MCSVSSLNERNAKHHKSTNLVFSQPPSCITEPIVSCPKDPMHTKISSSYDRRVFFCTCAELLCDMAASLSSRRSKQRLHCFALPLTLAPSFELAMAFENSDIDFCCLHCLFAQVQSPGTRRPEIHSLQQCFGEPSASSHMAGSKSLSRFSLLHFPHRFLLHSKQIATPSLSRHCRSEYPVLGFPFLHLGHLFGTQFLHTRAGSARFH